MQLVNLFRSHAGEYRSDVSVFSRLVRQSLQEYDRQHGASGGHKAASEGPHQVLYLFLVRQHMSLPLREGQAALLAPAVRELAEQAGPTLDSPMDVPADRRRRPRESLRQSYRMAAGEILGRTLPIGRCARIHGKLSKVQININVNANILYKIYI